MVGHLAYLGHEVARHAGASPGHRSPGTESSPTTTPEFGSPSAVSPYTPGASSVKVSRFSARVLLAGESPCSWHASSFVGRNLAVRRPLVTPAWRPVNRGTPRPCGPLSCDARVGIETCWILRPKGSRARPLDLEPMGSPETFPTASHTHEPDPARRPRMSQTVGDYFWGPDEGNGASGRSSATRATASTGCSAPSTGQATISSSSRSGTRRWRPSWPRLTPSSRAISGSVWRPPGPGPPTSSPACTTPAWTTCRCSPSPASRPANALGGHYQQELDLVSMYKDVAGALRPAGELACPDAPSRGSRHPDRQERAQGDRAHLPQRPPGRSLRGAAPQARHHPFGRRLRGSPGRALRGRSEAGGGGAECGQEGRDPGRGRGARRDGRGDRGRRQAGRRRRKGASRQGRPAGRPALGHGLDRPSRDQALLRPDDGVRTRS